ncbi:EAL domain-containing protein [Peteryoungia desertarenae]|uniref:EAL domain-containing protein n=1 Tax=Peteryoungia desertarenae TaxID=1813451 RepID=A0ABX6QIH8_9HYPH|nr:EAL domain-containing protein [Peteryoungia desertarenae]QLF68333.1 EAL domain-containing protein [Peteryoungia desertarenae]
MAMGCVGCQDGKSFDVAFSMAFQPIVNLENGDVFAYEALVRGPEGEGASTILSQVDETNRYAFDQRCRVRAIELAAQLMPPYSSAKLSINFMPNAVYEPRACIKLTLATAKRVGFPLERIIFEFTEGEQTEPEHLLSILRTYQDMGFKTAIDDFGAGHSGLNLLARFQPDLVKLDMDLIRGLDVDRPKRIVVQHTVAMLKDLGVTVIGEGVESEGERDLLHSLGVELQQGYLFARPSFEAFVSSDY